MTQRPHASSDGKWENRKPRLALREEGRK